jgi:hypothetical protein
VPGLAGVGPSPDRDQTVMSPSTYDGERNTYV